MTEQQITARLRALAEKTVADCTFVKRALYTGEEKDTFLLLPSGDEKYGSFWVRDAVFMSESGVVPADRMREMLTAIASCGQNGTETRYLANGLIIPPYAVADHINYNGKPVYYPGTCADGDDQGDGTFGIYPPFCDNYCFILLAAAYLRATADRAVLAENFSGMTLLSRLRGALAGYNIEKDTGLCVSDEDRFTVNWGFVDTVRQSGALLFASLLRFAAARAMAEIDGEKREEHLSLCATLRESIQARFYDEKSGFFFADDTDRQKDVWGTAYAVFLGIGNAESSRALAAAYQDGRAGKDGYIRHILTNEDAAPGKTAWRRCLAAYGSYQNGALWATPLGWYLYAVRQTDPALAHRMAEEFLAHTERYAPAGAPFEYIRPDMSETSGCLYGTSGILPYLGWIS